MNADLQRRVDALTAALAQADAELDTVSFNLAHDLRAPLRAIEGFAAALLEDDAGPPHATVRDYVERMARAARGMDARIQALIAYRKLARMDVRLGTLDLAAAVAEALRQLQGELQQRSATVAVAGPLPSVHGHSLMLIQAVSGLLSNAVKFVAPGVTPRVSLRAEPRDAQVRLWVEDNGIGIASEQLTRIFRPFERLHGIEAYAGCGMGLAIVVRVMQRMGGRAGVESAPGRGSRFWIELPAAGTTLPPDAARGIAPAG